MKKCFVCKKEMSLVDIIVGYKILEILIGEDFGWEGYVHCKGSDDEFLSEKDVKILNKMKNLDLFEGAVLVHAKCTILDFLKEKGLKTSTKPICEVCGKNTSVGVACIPMVPMSVAYCQECLNANAHPWWALVANTALAEGLEHCNKEWKQMVEDTCTHLGKTLTDFNTDVVNKIREFGEGTESSRNKTCTPKDQELKSFPPKE